MDEICEGPTGGYSLATVEELVGIAGTMTEPSKITYKRLSAVRSKDTKPERAVGLALAHLGIEFEQHREDLPGSPDFVLPAEDMVLFVHGCFWHQHEGCDLAPTPKRNRSYWDRKFTRNKERDRENRRDLEEDGWRVGIVWECEARSPSALMNKIEKILDKEKEL